MAATKKLPSWLDKGADVKSPKKGAKKSEKPTPFKFGGKSKGK